MHPVLIKFGPITLASYGLMLAIAILTGIYIARRQAELEGVDSRVVESMAFWVVVAGILGARVLYTFVENSDYYFKHPWQFFSFRSGGISFLGGLFFSIGGALLYCRIKNLPFFKMTDLMAPSVALGNGIAKIGCFLAGCCYGRACDLPWAVTFNHPESLAEPKGVPLHPAQLYESVWSIALFFLLLWIRTRRRFYGEVLAALGVTFGGGRVLIETFRGEPRMFGNFSIHQTLSLTLALFSLVLWVLIRKKKISTEVPA